LARAIQGERATAPADSERFQSTRSVRERFDLSAR
jgi:hypothetical protein